MGADPMILARLEQTAMQAQRGFDQSQQQQYAQGLSDLWEQQQRFGETIGTGGRGGGGQPQNPYLQMLLQSQLGMGGGRGGSPTGGLGSIGRG